MGSGGPELWVVAGVHGNENEGIACVDDVLDELEPTRGTLVGVPVAHPAALRAGTRRGVDDVDLNRVYPGSADGGVTERVAQALWRELDGHASALVTLHSWHAEGAATPYVEHAAGDEAGRALAHALGVPFVEAWDWPPGLLPAAATRAGVVSAELELGGLGAQTPQMLAVGVAAVAGAMRHLGHARRGATARGQRRARGTCSRRRMTAACGSCSRSAPPSRGERPSLSVRELGGDVLETLASPVDGWLGIHNTYGFVQAGEDVVIVFEAT